MSSGKIVPTSDEEVPPIIGIESTNPAAQILEDVEIGKTSSGPATPLEEQNTKDNAPMMAGRLPSTRRRSSILSNEEVEEEEVVSNECPVIIRKDGGE